MLKFKPKAEKNTNTRAITPPKNVGPLFYLKKLRDEQSDKSRGHVNHAAFALSVSQYKPQGEAICSDCNKVLMWNNVESFLIQVEGHGFGRCINQTKEQNEMAMPTATGGEGSGSRSRSTRRDGPPWLKTEHLTDEPKRAKILALKVEKSKYNDLVLKITMGGQAYFWGLKTSYATYKAMLDRFGDDENNWTGSEILLNNQLDEFSEQKRIHVEFPDEQARPNKTRSARA